jgi:hypothetical protein
MAKLWLALTLISFVMVTQFTCIKVSRIKSVKCSSSNKSLSFYNCFVLTHNFANTTLNIESNLTRPTYDAKVNKTSLIFKRFLKIFLQFSLVISFKAPKESNRTIINTTVEICEVLNGTSNHPATKFFLEVSNNLLSQNLLHHCPYQGHYKFFEIALGSRNPVISSAFRVGFYYTIIRFFDTLDANILTIKVNSEHFNSRQKF